MKNTNVSQKDIEEYVMFVLSALMKSRRTLRDFSHE